MSTYNDGWNDHAPRASICVHEETRSAKVTYPNPNGGKPFRVMVHQKSNPIGFHARLPGDKASQNSSFRRALKVKRKQPQSQHFHDGPPAGALGAVGAMECEP